MTGHTVHIAAKSLIFPLPVPGSKPNPAPVPWDKAHPYRGLGFRSVDAVSAPAAYKHSPTVESTATRGVSVVSLMAIRALTNGSWETEH
jgi:hypothetical protein